MERELQAVQESLEQILHNFPKLASGPALIREIAAESPQQFCEVALELLRKEGCNSGPHQFLGSALLRTRELPQTLVAWAVARPGDALEACRELKKVDKRLEARLLRRLSAGRPELTALLDVLIRSSDDPRVLQLLTDARLHEDPNVASKAVLMVGQHLKNATFVQEQMKDRNGRVRANAVESLWGATGEEVEKVLLSCLNDSEPRVIGNALVGLYQMSEEKGVPLIVKMAYHLDAPMRVTAAWVMGRCPNAIFARHLQALVRDPDTRVMTKAIRSLNAMRRLGLLRMETEGAPALASAS